MADTDELDECDVVVPISKIASYLEYVNSLQDKHQIRSEVSVMQATAIFIFMYAVTVCPQDEWEAKCKAAMDDMYAEADRIGGLVSGEHGIGHANRNTLKSA